MALIALEDIVPVKPRSSEAAPASVRPVIRKETAPTGDVAARNAPEPTAETTRSATLAGGFAAVRDDLERRTRESAHMVRLLEQHRQHLEATEKERDAAYEELARIIPRVEDSARELKTAMGQCKAGELGADLASLWLRNGKALEELENVAANLASRFLWCRSAWEQYAKSIVVAQRLRAEAGRIAAESAGEAALTRRTYGVTSSSRAKRLARLIVSATPLRSPIFTRDANNASERAELRTLRGLFLQVADRQGAALAEQEVEGLQHQRVDLRPFRVGDVAELVIDGRLQVDGQLLGALLERAARGRRDRRRIAAERQHLGLRLGRRGGRRRDDGLQAQLRRLWHSW